MHEIVGTEGGSERVILLLGSWSLYLAIKPYKKYYRLFVGPFFTKRFYVERQS